LNRAGIAPAIQRQEIHLFKGVKERGEEVATKPRTVLEEVDIFRPFSDSAKNYLSERMQLQRIGEGEVIVRQGEMGDSLFILVEGVVGVRVQAQHGEPIEVARLGAGNFFGEMALLTGEERTATVVAVTNTLLFEITKENIAGLMSQQPEVSELISKILTERQIMTQSQIHVQRDTPIEEEAIYKRFRERIESFFGLRN
jgi:branched-chain amino acid transport system substrate-binding protein